MMSRRTCRGTEPHSSGDPMSEKAGRGPARASSASETISGSANVVGAVEASSISRLAVSSPGSASRRGFVWRLVSTGAIAVPVIVAATVTPQAHARP